MKHTILVPRETRDRAARYFQRLRANPAAAGARFREVLAAGGSDDELLGALLNTKVPVIFAESAVAGDGSDWNATELGILGDLSIAVPVTVFDDGRHVSPRVHEMPFSATLLFTPGALLANGQGHEPVDLAEVTDARGGLSQDGLFRLYERRLLPVFQHADAVAAGAGKQALVTVPGLGCGQFAGRFRGQLGAALGEVLEKFLVKHGGSLTNIQAVWFDPYDECGNARREIGGISFFTRPLLRGLGRPQLCPPALYQEAGDDFSNCVLASIVAWDHVSWPGNDFFGGSRCTDDGVKAAATDSMAVLTGVTGCYDAAAAAYLPPPPFRIWREVVERRGARL